ncbi:hypothetical protein NA57DRAFT_72618 [Rhizodiscina lignyota]|uniref:Uncharacterized protein n=1 Tax=Rhizodiscina lignyota TaxID=1504668 RepID=A0A9P4IL05_9PEZI|nr:hypothetical protein NA57DRAFT_72618 [Rhizodiscina lignyota]
MSESSNASKKSSPPEYISPNWVAECVVEPEDVRHGPLLFPPRTQLPYMIRGIEMWESWTASKNPSTEYNDTDWEDIEEDIEAAPSSDEQNPKDPWDISALSASRLPLRPRCLKSGPSSPSTNSSTPENIEADWEEIDYSLFPTSNVHSLWEVWDAGTPPPPPPTRLSSTMSRSWNHSYKHKIRQGLVAELKEEPNLYEALAAWTISNCLAFRGSRLFIYRMLKMSRRGRGCSSVVESTEKCCHVR